MFGYFYQTPAEFDDIMLRSDGEVLTGLWFVGSKDAGKHQINEMRELPIFAETVRWLDAYFGGCEPDFTPQYRIEGATEFRREVLGAVSRIPFGATTTYGEIAQELATRRGIAKMSSRAVGGAVGWNPICLIVPCHRVVGADGRLTGYGGGIENKVALLRLEGHGVDNLRLLDHPNKLL